MNTVVECLELVFGRGDDDYPFWLLTVRLNVLVFLLCTAFVIAWHASPARLRKVLPATWWTLAAVTILAGVLRFLVVPSNLFDFGGVPYSRLLYGYRGYFATAQFYSPWYQLTGRDIEHGILFQRIAATLTIPLVYGLCRLAGDKVFAAIAALLFSLYPLHVLFSASDSLAVFATLLAASSYLVLACAVSVEDRRIAGLHYLSGFSGLALLTQVRPETVLLLIPAALGLMSRRSLLRLRELMLPLAVSAAFALVYAFQVLAMGISRQNPIDVERGVNLTTEHLLLNPFMAIPVLVFATAVIGLYRGVRLAALAILPWVAVLILCVLTVEDGHGAARIYANWLILILPFAGYGLSLLWSAPQRVARLFATVALLYLALLPIISGDRLTAQYIEIIENDQFKALLGNVPPDVERIIVPDDELLWREHHSTLELYRKYAAIFSSRPQRAQRLQLVALTEYLDDAQRPSCANGTCVFFSGIPCMDQDLYAVTRGQCETLLREHRTSLLTDSSVVAAPFVACSVYSGKLKRQICDPATAARNFRTYRIDG